MYFPKITMLDGESDILGFLTKCLINSAGHDALRIEKKLPFGFDVSHLEDFPVKGNYFSYFGKNPFSHLIYPMPDELGLGIHSTHNINNELKLIGKPTISKDNVIDTLDMAREKFPGSSISLDALCKRFRIDNSRRKFHTALIDCELLSKVYINLTDQKEP